MECCPKDNVRTSERDVDRSRRSPASPQQGASAAWADDRGRRRRRSPVNSSELQITIEKNAPTTAVWVTNGLSNSRARQAMRLWVVVEDVVSQDVKIDGSIPQASQRTIGWSRLGFLAASQEKRFQCRRAAVGRHDWRGNSNFAAAAPNVAIRN